MPDGRLTNKLFMPDIFEINSTYFYKSKRNTCLSSLIDGFSISVMENKKNNAPPMNLLYQIIDNALEYLDKYVGSTDKKSMYDVDALGADYYTLSLLIKNPDLDTANIPRIRKNILKFQSLLENPPKTPQKRLSFAQLLFDYAEIIFKFR